MFSLQRSSGSAKPAPPAGGLLVVATKRAHAAPDRSDNRRELAKIELSE